MHRITTGWVQTRGDREMDRNSNRPIQKKKNSKRRQTGRGGNCFGEVNQKLLVDLKGKNVFFVQVNIL